ncbi:hypothetical protein AXF42_Ash001539 [Apostasia shenzhenica]|uniref:Uncharacterized protein n=1 Tax=Apostasia shenzhenica TaxID=1088818 RepID=A0A2I0AAI2_9ASPA|nr:hypothetical protein AXF42_Ash001539 [Apostasia shenzhenica]
MGLFGSCFTFFVGASCGIYVSQNYHVPDLKKLAQMGIGIARQYDELYRKKNKELESSADQPPLTNSPAMETTAMSGHFYGNGGAFQSPPPPPVPAAVPPQRRCFWRPPRSHEPYYAHRAPAAAYPNGHSHAHQVKLED